MKKNIDNDEGIIAKDEGIIAKDMIDESKVDVTASFHVKGLEGMPKDLIVSVVEQGITAVHLKKGVIKCTCGETTFTPVVKHFSFDPKKEDILLLCSACGKDLNG
jgi:hypothetical protein